MRMRAIVPRARSLASQVYYPKAPLGVFRGVFTDAFVALALASLALTAAAAAVLLARAMDAARSLALQEHYRQATAATRSATAAAAHQTARADAVRTQATTTRADAPALRVGLAEGAAATWLALCLLLAPTVGLDGGDHLCYLTAGTSTLTNIRRCSSEQPDVVLAATFLQAGACCACFYYLIRSAVVLFPRVFYPVAVSFAALCCVPGPRRPLLVRGLCARCAAAPGRGPVRRGLTCRLLLFVCLALVAVFAHDVFGILIAYGVLVVLGVPERARAAAAAGSMGAVVPGGLDGGAGARMCWLRGATDHELPVSTP